MSRPRSHAELESLLGAYALDAVDGPEAEVVRLHLLECPRCRAEVADHRETAALLGYAGAMAPEGLWDRIATELGSAQPEPARDGPMVVADPAATLSGAAPPRPAPSGPAQVRPAPDLAVLKHGGTRAVPGRRRRVSLRAAALAAAAAVAAIGGLGYELTNLAGQVGRLQAAVQKESAGLLPSEARSRLISYALTTPGHEVVAMSAGTDAETAEAVLLPSGQGYLVRSSLPHLPSTQTYQLWALIGTRHVSLGLLGPSPDQSSFTVGPVDDVRMLAVTVEPRGGVVQPTSPAAVWGSPA